MSKYKVGIVGCGGIAHFHGNNYNRFDEFEIVSVADINQESVDQYAEEFSVSGKYTNYLRMFEEEDLDVVSVCTWQGTHAEITIAAAGSGVKGILCEKPMAINLGEAESMIEEMNSSPSPFDETVMTAIGNSNVDSTIKINKRLTGG